MDEREQQRKIRHRLAVLRHAEEVSGNVAATCRYYGISRPTFYKWLHQYEEFGEEGLRDRSSRPRTCPHQTDGEVVAKIVYLRQHYHFGPAKIAMYLARYHDVAVSRSGVWRILKRLDMNRLPSSQRYKRHDRRWKRYEKQLPGHRVQVDVKFIEPLASSAASGGRKKRYYQFTAIDDCTRIRVLRIYERNTRRTPSSSSTTCWPSSPSPSSSCRPTTAPSSKTRSTGTCSTGGLATTTSSPRPPGSTAKWSVPTASTTRSSTDCSTGSSSTTPTCSTRSSRSGRTSTTSTDPTAASTARPPTTD
jgi:transposase